MADVKYRSPRCGYHLFGEVTKLSETRVVLTWNFVISFLIHVTFGVPKASK